MTHTPAVVHGSITIPGLGLKALDRVAKNGSVVLSEEDVIAIRVEYARDLQRMADLAKKYNVSIGAIHFIVIGRTWKHVGGPTHHTKSTDRPTRSKFQ